LEFFFGELVELFFEFVYAGVAGVGVWCWSSTVEFTEMLFSALQWDSPFVK